MSSCSGPVFFTNNYLSWEGKGSGMRELLLALCSREILHELRNKLFRDAIPDFLNTVNFGSTDDNAASSSTPITHNSSSSTEPSQLSLIHSVVPSTLDTPHTPIISRHKQPTPRKMKLFKYAKEEERQLKQLQSSVGKLQMLLKAISLTKGSLSKSGCLKELYPLPGSLVSWNKLFYSMNGDGEWAAYKPFEIFQRVHADTYVSTGAFNQDPLENLFGCKKGNCLSNTHPTVTQFIGSLKSSLISGLAFSASTARQNCEDDIALLDSLQALIGTVKVECVREEDIKSPLSGFLETDTSEENAVEILALTCSQLFTTVNSCERCKAAMMELLKVCSRHFTEECFSMKTSRPRLKVTAVPTIFDFPRHLMPKVSSRLATKRLTFQDEDITQQNINRYIGDFTEEDMNSPSKTNKALQLAQENCKNSRLMSRRLKEKLTSLQDLLKDLRKKFHTSETAGEILEASLPGPASELLKRAMNNSGEK
ncbi:hypothetical protein J437_LFUL010752 [Ladona fulva]|uniref:Uncharacterized protein n=1 Tax=Ladona fulva TaxID=123851 RepID=A0A8K0KCA2_LADFU|nr:hypothetical protein J437_LFUL010752 [Ladona fulva]